MWPLVLLPSIVEYQTLPRLILFSRNMTINVVATISEDLLPGKDLDNIKATAPRVPNNVLLLFVICFSSFQRCNERRAGSPHGFERRNTRLILKESTELRYTGR